VRFAEATATAPGYGHENLGPVFARLLPEVLSHLRDTGAIVNAHPKQERVIIQNRGTAVSRQSA
jgi:hypothetical protein